MSEYYGFKDSDDSNTYKKTEQKSESKKGYVSPRLIVLDAIATIEGGSFTRMNENSNGLVSGAS